MKLAGSQSPSTFRLLVGLVAGVRKRTLVWDTILIPLGPPVVPVLTLVWGEGRLQKK